jgi:RNA polymerase sigma factor (sigma-70 family)
MPPDSSTLVARVSSGDPEALALLFRQHAARVHEIAFRLTRSADEADDVVQDVFVGLPDALRGYRDDGRFDAWLARVAMRVALMRMRRARAYEPLTGDVPAGAQRDDAAATDARLSIERALATLPPAARAVFVRRELEGRTHAEIAAELGISRNSSEVRLFRALRQIRSFLRDSR